jgi:hypothetical protein
MKQVTKFEDFINENKTQTIFNTNDKRVIRGKMDDVLINFFNTYDDKLKKSVKDDISKFIDKSLGDLYETIIDVLEKKK